MNLSEINLNDFDLREAGDWPWVGKIVLVVLVIAAVLGAGVLLFTSDHLEELDRVTREEQQLRQEFIEKQRVAANLESFRAQLKQMETELEVMLQQLPTGTEMPDLLEDVSSTGKKNGLDFDIQARDRTASDFMRLSRSPSRRSGDLSSVRRIRQWGYGAVPDRDLENATLTSTSDKAAKGGKESR